ncbi:MAG: hypothetical protein ACR2KZ_12470, partial [Segetibacter sp.]
MRQLDLFGFFEPPQENKPEEKPAVEKKEEGTSIAEDTKPAYSKNSLRSETLAANEFASTSLNGAVEIDKEPIGQTEASIFASTSTLSLFEDSYIGKGSSAAQEL